MIRLAAVTLALMLSTTAGAFADQLDDEIAKFISADGFEELDVMALETKLDDQWLDTNAMSPGGTVGPIEKAILLATEAIDSTRTRTAISYGELLVEEDASTLPVSFIEVRHYNLGPAIRAEAVDAYGAENVDDEAAFGVGEHKAWRFVFQPLMGNSAILMSASSRTISDKQATKDQCNGTSCLDLAFSFDETAEWQEIPGNLPVWTAPYKDREDGVVTPAYSVAQLAMLGFWANAESGQYAWTGGEHPEAIRDATPYRFISIDRNLGQEISIDTVWRETHVNDDAIQAISFRQVDIAGYATLMSASDAR